MSYLTGVGMTPYGKLPGRTTLDLMSEAATTALNDAQLERKDIDGLLCGYSTTFPHLMLSTTFVEHFGLRGLFDGVYGSELDGTREDKRDLLEHLLPHHGIAPADAAMIGDRGADMAAARHHGLHAVGALWGYGTREELLGAGAQALCAAPGGIPEAIRR